MAKHLGLAADWLYRRIYPGAIQPPALVRQAPHGNYLIRDNPVLMDALRLAAEQLHPKRQAYQAKGGQAPA